jgi:hypothetical protein
MTVCENIGCLALKNGNNIKHCMIKMKADIELRAGSFSVVTLRYLHKCFPVLNTLKKLRPTSKDRFSNKATFHMCRTINMHKHCV